MIAIHLEGGREHEHFTSVNWPMNGEAKISTKADMVGWINKGGKAYVADGVRTVDILVVNATPQYLRTYADGRWCNNLLALPQF